MDTRPQSALGDAEETQSGGQTGSGSGMALKKGRNPLQSRTEENAREVVPLGGGERNRRRRRRSGSEEST